MNAFEALKPHRSEFSRAFRNHKYEFTDNGVLFPEQGVIVCGHFDTWINGRDHQIDANKLTTEGINHMLSVTLHADAQVVTWYVALFSANVAPQSTLTAANFVATQTEFVGYNEATRVAFVPSVPAAGELDNTASRSTFTINTGATIYGSTLQSVNTKSGTTGTCLAGSLYAAGRAVLAADTFQAAYTLTITSPSRLCPHKPHSRP